MNAQKSNQFRVENIALDLIEFCESTITQSKINEFFKMRVDYHLTKDQETQVVTKAKLLINNG